VADAAPDEDEGEDEGEGEDEDADDGAADGADDGADRPLELVPEPELGLLVDAVLCWADPGKAAATPAAPTALTIPAPTVTAASLLMPLRLVSGVFSEAGRFVMELLQSVGGLRSCSTYVRRAGSDDRSASL
jgi:hypothetical protein